MAIDAVFTGQTFRATVSALADAGGVALTDPNVTITMRQPGGVLVTGDVIPSGSAFYSEFSSEVEGSHKVIAVAEAGGTTWVSESTVLVRSR